MYIDDLETARVVHSFFEHWSLYFFEALVGCELAELFIENLHGWNWRPITRLSAAGPAHQTLFSPHSFVKIASLACFAMAIGLEFAALESSSIVDNLTDEALSYSGRQTRDALVVAGDANREANIVGERASKLSDRATKAEHATEELKAKNIEMEKAVLPRTVANQTQIARDLEPFAGTPVMFETVADFEPIRLMGLLSATLELAHWTLSPRGNIIQMGGSGVELFSPGVWIELTPPGTLKPTLLRINPARDAAELTAKWNAAASAGMALAEILTRNGIQARIRPRSASTEDPAMPSSTLRVFISLKPMPGQAEERLTILPPRQP